jgi:MFS family permease
MLRKLLIIIMGIFLGICAGSCNLYPIYLDIMKNKYDYTIKQVNLYGVFINIGLWVAFPMGFIYDTLGPKFSLALGAFLLSGSYLTLHFLLNSDLTNLPLVVFLIVGLCMGQGSALLYTTSVTTNLKNFRFKESSTIVGLLVASLAISPSIFSTYREAFKDLQIGSFLLVISIVTFVIIFICGFIFYNIRNVYSEEQKSYEKYKEKKIIKVLIYFNISILAIYTFGVIYNNNFETKFPLIIVYPCLQMLNFIVVILEKYKVFDKFYFKDFINKQIRKSMLLSPTTVKKRNTVTTHINIIKDHSQNNANETGNESKEDTQVDISLQEKDDKNAIQNNSVDTKDNTNNTLNDSKIDKLESILPKLLSKDPTFIQSIKSFDILLLLIILILGIGSVVANINNINFIVNSVTSPSQTETNIYTYVILYFVFNSFTRISSGLILDYLIKIKRLFYYLLLASCLGLLSQLLGIFMNRISLYISICLAGATHGSYMTFIPVFVRNEYGLSHMGKILGMLTTGCAIGALLVADLLFTVFWDLNYSEESKACIGARCFYGSYMITSGFFMINIVLSVILLKRYLIKVTKI